MAATPGIRSGRLRLRPFWRWLDERLGLADLAYPVPAHANSVLYTLGGITLFGVFVLIATGIYLTQFYHADPAQARESVEYMAARQVPELVKAIRGAYTKRQKDEVAPHALARAGADSALAKYDD